MLSARRIRRLLGCGCLALAAIYALLFIPEPTAAQPKDANRQAFLWNRDAFWTELELKFRAARALAPDERIARFNTALEQVHRGLDLIAVTNLPPSAPVFDQLETNFFQLT